jgi:hypothetical protein
MALSGGSVERIGLDVHRDFIVVAICEDGKVRSGGRVPRHVSNPGLVTAVVQPLDEAVDGAIDEPPCQSNSHPNRTRRGPRNGG